MKVDPLSLPSMNTSELNYSSETNCSGFSWERKEPFPSENEWKAADTCLGNSVQQRAFLMHDHGVAEMNAGVCTLAPTET